MKRTVIKTVGIGFLLAAGFALQAQAELITDTSTFRILDSGNDGTGNEVHDNQLWAGNIAGSDWAVVSSFQMTGFSSGTEIANVDFSITKDTTVGDPNLSLDVLRTSNSSTINAGDYEFAPAANLVTDFADGANTSYSLDVSGQVALTTYLQSNWVEDDFVFIRIRSGVIGPAPAGQAYRFGGNSAGSDALLTLTGVVPEPSTLALLGAGAAMLIASRHRTRRSAFHKQTA